MSKTHKSRPGKVRGRDGLRGWTRTSRRFGTKSAIRNRRKGRV